MLKHKWHKHSKHPMLPGPRSTGSAKDRPKHRAGWLGVLCTCSPKEFKVDGSKVIVSCPKCKRHLDKRGYA